MNGNKAKNNCSGHGCRVIRQWAADKERVVAIVYDWIMKNNTFYSLTDRLGVHLSLGYISFFLCVHSVDSNIISLA